MIQFKNFEEFVNYLIKTHNLIEVPSNLANDNFKYTYFLIHPYRIKINGETVIVRYIASDDNFNNISSDYKRLHYLYEELPISFDYFYPEDKNTHINVVVIKNKNFLESINAYGIHGVKVSGSNPHSPIEEITILNAGESVW